MTAAEQAAAKGGQVVQVPVDLGAEGVVYNLSLPAGSRLHLTGPVLARIFLGQITSWHDPAITALNPGVNLPDARISVVHRSDGSGTTYIFSNYLSSVSPAWAAKVGAGKIAQLAGRGGRRRQWRGGRFGLPHPVLHRIRRTVIFERPAPAFRRHPQQGRPLRHPIHPVRRRGRSPETRHHADRLLNRQPARRSSYPSADTAGRSSMPTSPARPPGSQLVSLLDWLTHAGQAYAAATSYVPLPPGIRQLAHTMLQQVTGPHGTHLLG